MLPFQATERGLMLLTLLGISVFLAGPLTIYAQGTNSPATGQPTITGTPRVGETLTVDISGIADPDGMENATFGFNWYADDDPQTPEAFLRGGSAPTYTVPPRDVGLTILVRAYFADDQGNQEFLESAPTVVVVPTVPEAPHDVEVTPNNDRGLDISWTAPYWDLGSWFDGKVIVGDGGSPVTGYKVQWKQVACSWDVAADVSEQTVTGTTYTISGLIGGVAYAVRVISSNSVGNSVPSAEETGAPAGTGSGGCSRKGGGSDGGSNGSGSSSGRGSSGRSLPPPAPTRSPIIGSTAAATAVELAGDLMVLRRHDEPGVEVEVGIGWISRDGHPIIVIGFVRDGDLGQTYAVVRREGDGQVVRRWIAPDSPLVYAVPWEIVNTQYTFPVGVIAAIPLDEQYPAPNMLTRRFDGGDDRILAYDAGLGQWRHVPDPATFQARGYYWCNVTAADAGFFERVTLGPPYPASDVPARADYPVCQT